MTQTKKDWGPVRAATREDYDVLANAARDGIAVLSPNGDINVANNREDAVKALTILRDEYRKIPEILRMIFNWQMPRIASPEDLPSYEDWQALNPSMRDMVEVDEPAAPAPQPPHEATSDAKPLDL